MTDKSFLFIVNPRSGSRRGLAILKQVEPVFAAADAELHVRVTERSGHARQIAQELEPARYNGLCLIGGDGTVHEAVSGLLERGEPPDMSLGIIPGGAGNDLARHLGAGSPLDAARHIVAGQTRPFDVARVEGGGQINYCVSHIGWAGVAAVNCKAERLRMLGPPRYAAAALWQVLVSRRRGATLVLDDQALEDDFLFVVACNTIFAGSGMRLAPRAKVDDGKIDVVILRNATRWRMFHLFPKVFDGSHVDTPYVEYYQVHSLRILSDDREPLVLDGEVKGTAPVSIETMPGAVRFFARNQNRIASQNGRVGQFRERDAGG